MNKWKWWPGKAEGLLIMACMVCLAAFLVLGPGAAPASAANGDRTDLEGAAPVEPVETAEPVETPAETPAQTPADSGDIKIVIDSEPIIMETAPIIENDRVLVPVKSIFEAMGARVLWQANTQGIVVQKTDLTIVMHLYHPLAYINKELVVMDVPPVAREERTFVPLRFVSQAMDYDVRWDASTRTVNISRKSPAAASAAYYLP